MIRCAHQSLWGNTIGVDLGSRLVKVCQRHARGWDSFTLVRERTGHYTSAEIGGIVRAIARHGMSGSCVAASVPQAIVLSARASTPRENSGAPIDEITRQELARSSGADVNALLATSWSARSRRARGELDERQIFGCPVDAALKLHEAFAEHGMDLIALEPGMVSTARGALDAAGLSGMPGLVVDLGWDSVRLIAAEAGRLVYERSVTGLGQQHLAARLSSACSLSGQHSWALSGMMSRRGGLDAILQAHRAVASVIHNFADELMLEIERGVSFAGERYGVGSDRGVLSTGGGAVGALAHALQEISGGQIKPACDAEVSPLHAAARGLAIMMEVSHATSQPAA